MKDLIDYKNQRIEALQKEVCKLNKKIGHLETYIFEVTDKDCPEEYKKLVRKEVFYE